MIKKVCCVILTCLVTAIVSAQNLSDPRLSDPELIWINTDNFPSYNFHERIKGKVVLLEFWEHWCAPCLGSMPHLQELCEAFPNDLRIIAISSDDLAKSRKIVDARNYGYDFVFDQKGVFEILYPHTGIPHTVMFNSQGEFLGTAHPETITTETIRQIISGSYPLSAASASADDRVFRQMSEQQPGLLIHFNLSRVDQSGDSFGQSTRNSVSQIEWNGFNIRHMIAFAYQYPLQRTTYTENVSYVNAKSKEHLYNLSFFVAEENPVQKEMLQNFLSAAFGLEVRTREDDEEIWIIKDIQQTESIKVNSSDQSGNSKVCHGEGFFSLSYTGGSGKEIASTLEERVGIPILLEVSDDQLQYAVDIEVVYGEGGKEKIYELLRDAGLILEKDTRKITKLVIDSRSK